MGAARRAVYARQKSRRHGSSRTRCNPRSIAADNRHYVKLHSERLARPASPAPAPAAHGTSPLTAGADRAVLNSTAGTRLPYSWFPE